MSARQEIYIECDYCGAVDCKFNDKTAKLARCAAEQHGWASVIIPHTGHVDWCPDCKIARQEETRGGFCDDDQVAPAPTERRARMNTAQVILAINCCINVILLVLACTLPEGSKIFPIGIAIAVNFLIGSGNFAIGIDQAETKETKRR